MTFVRVGNAPDGAPADLVLVPGANLIAGDAELATQLGGLSTLEADLLTTAAAIFASDLGIRRGDRELVVRSIELQIPVVHRELLQSHAALLSSALYLVSDDHWRLDFIEKAEPPGPPMEVLDDNGSTTLLFSGGLDSAAAAASVLGRGEVLQLASHYTANPVLRRSQDTVREYFETAFGVDRLSSASARISARTHATAPFPADAERESSQRTRSVVFLVLAAIVACRKGSRRLLMMAENGQLAIHLPLTAARISAFSTHTAHPEFLSTMREWLSRVLQTPIAIENPFVSMTKAEVCQLLAPHTEVVAGTVSCWRSARMARSHCGECVPCLIRRIALEHNGWVLDEYTRDMFDQEVSALDPDDTGKRNLIDLAEFALRFSSDSEAVLFETYPELYSESLDAEATIAMYRRFASEAIAVFAGYESLQALVS